MKTTTGQLGAAAILAASMLALAPAHADEATMIANCTAGWNSSPASDHCTVTVSIQTVTQGRGWRRECEFSGSCSIAVEIDDVSTTFTPSVDHSREVANAQQLDICFAADSSEASGFKAAVKGPCPTSETGSDDAVSDGLTTD